jgi:hypothetical protein
MDTYNFIILFLIIILVLLYLWVNKLNKELFTTKYDTLENVFGNILDYNIDTDNTIYNKVFKKQYRITGIYIQINENDSYKIKINGSFISYNSNINLESDKYYDISDLNIKAKSFEVLSNNTIKKIVIYGLNDYNINNKSNYDSINIIDNTVNENSLILKGNEDYLISYIKLESNDIDFNIKYTNQFILTLKEYKSDISDLDNKYHKNSTRIYFDKPLLANKIQLENYNNNLNNIKIYGKYASISDIKIYQLENSDDSINKKKCPSLNNIIKKQKLINDLCNSITEKDKIRNQQTYYEKTKKYINKLKKQEMEIQALKLKLNNLLKNNENSSLSFKEKVSSIQSMVDEVNTENLFDKLNINYSD